MDNAFILKLLIYLNVCKNIISDVRAANKSSQFLQNSTKNLEEVHRKKIFQEESKEIKDNLESFLVNNVKEIFSETDEPVLLFDTENYETFLTLKPNFDVSTTENYEETFETTTDDKGLKESPTQSTAAIKTSIVVKRKDNMTYTKVNRSEKEKNKLLNISVDSIDDERDNRALQSINSSVLNIKSFEKEINLTRSCIFCDNMAISDCYDPKNKLIPSIVCEQEEDLCYSQHTPFGIVDRGCFNINNNFTTYVCSCNLCNYISISEMPFIFSSKRDWVENVIEMSRTKRFRKTIFKDMSCLRCEVNTSIQADDMVDNANCLEGNVGTLPIQECADNEICGVKTIRSEGYIWRGCLTKPLYNYWMFLCDTDLCNYDRLVSVYDYF